MKISPNFGQELNLIWGIAYRQRIKEDKAENMKKAIACYQKALQAYTRKEDLAETAFILGKIHVDQGSWYKGLEYLERSLKIYRQLNDFKVRADAIYQIALTHDLIGNYEEASVRYRDALRFYQHVGNSRGEAFVKAV